MKLERVITPRLDLLLEMEALVDELTDVAMALGDVDILIRIDELRLEMLNAAARESTTESDPE